MHGTVYILIIILWLYVQIVAICDRFIFICIFVVYFSAFDVLLMVYYGILDFRLSSKFISVATRLIDDLSIFLTYLYFLILDYCICCFVHSEIK